jgi:hypothetical protein
MTRINEKAVELVSKIQATVAQKYGRAVAAKVGLYRYGSQYLLFSGERLYLLDGRRWKVATKEWDVAALKPYRCDLLAIRDEWLAYVVLDALKDIQDGRNIAVEEE